jgi:hypothetical protein
MFQVARESAKQIICDVGHSAHVKTKLRLLLTSEICDVANMSHDGGPTERSIDEQGNCYVYFVIVIVPSLMPSIVNL